VCVCDVFIFFFVSFTLSIFEVLDLDFYLYYIIAFSFFSSIYILCMFVCDGSAAVYIPITQTQTCIQVLQFSFFSNIICVCVHTRAHLLENSVSEREREKKRNNIYQFLSHSFSKTNFFYCLW
jgi:hypothetical protein